MEKFKNNRNIVSVSLDDHLLFGEDDGRLLTPDALHQRMKYCHDEMGAITLHWRQIRHSIKHGRFFSESGLKQPFEIIKNNLDWD